MKCHYHCANATFSPLTTKPCFLLWYYEVSGLQFKVQTFTVVTVLDAPFTMKQPSVRLDGIEYCLTPAVPCLSLFQSVLISNGFSPNILRQMFAGMQSISYDVRIASYHTNVSLTPKLEVYSNLGFGHAPKTPKTIEGRVVWVKKCVRTVSFNSVVSKI